MEIQYGHRLERGILLTKLNKQKMNHQEETTLNAPETNSQTYNQLFSLHILPDLTTTVISDKKQKG
jgi:hypothetical protein